MDEPRNAAKFQEKLSIVMVTVAALGAFFVLADPKIVLTFWGQSISVTGVDFSADLKGAVISAILIGGWTAVKEFWLGSSAGSERKSEAIAEIAAGAPATAAAAVAAATGKPIPVAAGEPIVADNVHVEAQTATVTEVSPTEGEKKP